LKLSLISKGVIAICALVGFLMEMFLHGWHSIRYYTNQSNLLVVIFLIYLLLKYRKEGHWSQWDIRLKGGMTVAILLTGLVYHFMLAPLKTPEELAEMLSAETWLNGKECVEQGFADKLAEPLVAMASIKSRKLYC